MSLRTMLLATTLVSALAGCDASPTKTGPAAVPGRNEVDPAPTPRVPVVMPPSISVSKQYRCADGSLAFVDFYSDDRSASLRTAESGPAVRLVAPAPGQTMVAEGHSLKGGKADRNVTITTLAHPKALSCHT